MSGDLSLWNTTYYSPTRFNSENYERWRRGEKIEVVRAKEKELKTRKGKRVKIR